jgi:hypothetical protein
MEGIALLLTTLCVNNTYCPPAHADPAVNYYQFLPRDLYKTEEMRRQEMEKLAAEIKGQTLNVTTLEDYPLSYVIRNETLRGKGWAFEFFDILAAKFNFSYNVIMPDSNILGSSNDSQGSLMQMITLGVRKLIFRLDGSFNHFFSSKRADVGVAFVPLMADLTK